MDRRAFLRAAGFVGLSGALGGALAACGRDGTDAGDSAAGAGNGGATAGSDTFDPVSEVAPDATNELSVIAGSFEQLVGRERPFAFGLRGPENEPVTDAEVELWVVPVDGDPAGPRPTTFHEVSGNPFGLYLATVDLADPGPTSFVAVTADRRAGSAALPVTAPEDSQMPAPGQDAVSVPTATHANPTDLAELCTREPPCGMHDVSLESALAQGLPVALEFATPAYCQTAVCGPSVDVLEQVRTSHDWENVVFIHVEVFRDAGETLAQPVEAWELQSEPWLYVIDGEGRIVDRADGPLLTLPEQVTAMVEQLG